jgi:hypothetical protein
LRSLATVDIEAMVPDFSRIARAVGASEGKDGEQVDDDLIGARSDISGDRMSSDPRNRARNSSSLSARAHHGAGEGSERRTGSSTPHELQRCIVDVRRGRASSASDANVPAAAADETVDGPSTTEASVDRRNVIIGVGAFVVGTG